FIFLHGNKVANERFSQSLLQTSIFLQGPEGFFQLQRDLRRFWLVKVCVFLCGSPGCIAILKSIQACCNSGSQHQRQQCGSG
uniref:Uncharacterized protein n=1 Tax=Nannospalax galili TaxID=1026970 RepID=A0A8C6QEH4_NANGA